PSAREGRCAWHYAVRPLAGSGRLSGVPIVSDVSVVSRPAPRPRTVLAARIGALLAATALTPALAAEGMWTLDNLPRNALQAEYGFSPDQAWVDHAMQSSVRLAGGCSGSFVSPDGLVLTNAHCVVGCVQGLSSPERDLQNDGFVADARGEELQ